MSFVGKYLNRKGCVYSNSVHCYNFLKCGSPSVKNVYEIFHGVFQSGSCKQRGTLFIPSPGEIQTCNWTTSFPTSARYVSDYAFYRVNFSLKYSKFLIHIAYFPGCKALLFISAPPCTPHTRVCLIDGFCPPIMANVQFKFTNLQELKTVPLYIVGGGIQYWSIRLVSPTM